MAEESKKGKAVSKKPEALEITFKCRRCEKQKPLKEMRSITRFMPVLVVCRDCEKEMR